MTEQLAGLAWYKFSFRHRPWVDWLRPDLGLQPRFLPPYSIRKFLELSQAQGCVTPPLRGPRGRDLPAVGLSCQMPRPLPDSPIGVLGPPGVGDE